jgi:hypothetical protein
LIHPDVDKAVLLRWLKKRLEPGESLDLHHNMDHTWSLEWALRRPMGVLRQFPRGRAAGRSRYFVTDARFTPGAELEELAAQFQVHVVGPFWVVDRGVSPGPIRGYAFEADEPTGATWFWFSAHDPVYRIEPDPFVTWELRHHFAQTPNTPPERAPASSEQHRVAYNIALDTGAEPAAQAHFAALGIDGRVAAEYASLPRLVGKRLDPGVAPRLWVYFQPADAPERDLTFAIHTLVEARKSLSLVPEDPKPRAVGMPFALPTSLWQPGFLYAAVSEVRKRPGTERFFGLWTERGNPVRDKTGPAEVDILP